MPQYFRSQIRVDAFVDALRYFYWLKPIKNKKLILDAVRKKSKKKFWSFSQNYFEQRLPNNQILEVRQWILKILSGITENSLTMEETYWFIDYLRDNLNDPDQTQDVLEMFSNPLLNFFNKKIGK